jgi:hypothetical protein
MVFDDKREIDTENGLPWVSGMVSLEILDGQLVSHRLYMRRFVIVAANARLERLVEDIRVEKDGIGPTVGYVDSTLHDPCLREFWVTSRWKLDRDRDRIIHVEIQPSVYHVGMTNSAASAALRTFWSPWGP